MTNCRRITDLNKKVEPVRRRRADIQRILNDVVAEEHVILREISDLMPGSCVPELVPQIDGMGQETGSMIWQHQEHCKCCGGELKEVAQ